MVFLGCFFVVSQIASIPFTKYLEQNNISILEFVFNPEDAYKDLSNKNMTLFLQIIPFTAVLIAFYFLIRWINQRHILTAITSKLNIRWNQFFFGFLLAVLLIAGTTLVDYLLNESNYIVQFDLKKFIPLLIISLVFLTIQASTEEILFRGYLMQGFGLATKSRLGALLLSSFIFALFHMANPEVFEHGFVKMFPIYFVLALSFGVMTLMNNGTELAMGFHSANNIMIALLVTHPEAVLQTDSILKATTTMKVDQQLLPLLISQTVVIAIFAWKYKWNNWKENLLGRIQ